MTSAGDCQRIGRSIRLTAGALCVILFGLGGRCIADERAAAAHFHERVEPVLETYCYACHGYGERKGGHAFDEFKSDKDLVADVKLWSAVLKNVRSGIMPPHDEEQPNDTDRRQIFDWIEYDAFGIDPADPDPGRVTLRRLNRAEYRNTIRDLTGVDYDTADEFPVDDSGYGFDNVGDALTVSPLLMEKYLRAAEAIVEVAVPAKAVDGHDQASQAKYRRLFPHGAAPQDAENRDAYAHEILAAVARRAYRRPVNDQTIDRLVAIAKTAYMAPGQTFEAGIGRAIVAVLASPRFLFRIEDVAPGFATQRYPVIDEYSLASRLSYFLWSTMPDDELMRLAERGELRANLPGQVKRMLNDSRSKALSENFAGQWLRARDVEHMEIEPVNALGLQDEIEKFQQDGWKLRHTSEHDIRWEDRERIRAEHRRLVVLSQMFSTDLRRAMRDETLAYFYYIVREDRNVLELIDSNYTFVNEKLAKHYGIDGVHGDAMQRVVLPAGSPRGGVLTQGTLLAVTSNPSRTSPVKRGLFILENILGSPPPPAPPPNVPILEVTRDSIKDHHPTIRESQERHRRDPLCHACHARMDPLGLALENFNAMGMWRETEQGQPIDASGTLLTGEKFDGIRQLKTIIIDQHRLDFYRCFAEKLLTYALGRGLEYYDEHTVDQIVSKLDRGHGKVSTLLMGVIESAPFQKQQRAKAVTKSP